jgi:hypothetical protein
VRGPRGQLDAVLEPAGVGQPGCGKTGGSCGGGVSAGAPTAWETAEDMASRSPSSACAPMMPWCAGAGASSGETITTAASATGTTARTKTAERRERRGRPPPLVNSTEGAGA